MTWSFRTLSVLVMEVTRLLNTVTAGVYIITNVATKNEQDNQNLLDPKLTYYVRACVAELLCDQATELFLNPALCRSVLPAPTTTTFSSRSNSVWWKFPFSPNHECHQTTKVSFLVHATAQRALL